MKTILLFLSTLFITTFSNAQYKYLKGVLSAAQAGATVNSFGSGVVIVRYNTVTRVLDHWGNFRGLSGDITNQHIHTGAPGVNGPVTIPLNRTGGTKDGGLFGSKVLTPTEEADLLAGNMYTNVHSTLYTGGEIRAQLTQTTDGQTEFLNARLQGAQSTPPNPSLGTGSVNALIDKATHTLYLTGTYSGLTTAANNAHIHLGAPTVSGSVIVPLNWIAGTSGTLDTARVINTTDEGNILLGNTYVNVHTSTYPLGEIRGQLLSATNLRYFANALQGTQEVPSNSSLARGTVIVRYNTQTNLLELWGDYQNLTTTVTGSHIHGPATSGNTAGILVNLTNTGGTMGTLTTSTTITELQEADLLNGLWYVNVHSSPPYDQGEIRAQLLPLSSGQTEFLTAAMDVDEERAAFPSSTITSSGVGTAVAVLDKITRNIYLTGSYSNLSAGISNTHIHRGPVAVSGPVSIQLQYIATTTSGTITGSATNITASLMDSIVNGNSYVNIHSSVYTTGEIRGQLGNIVLPVKLSYFNGYKDRSQVTLIWESAQEINVRTYELEQQNTATGEWVKKTAIAATGGSTSTKYQFNDVPTAGNKEYVLYRLKMIDYEGKVTYSPIIRISYLNSIAALTIMPNPVVKGKLTYTITGIRNDQKAEISIIDFNGRLMLKAVASTLLNNSVDLNRLSSGMYKLVIKTNDSVLSESFIKQ